MVENALPDLLVHLRRLADAVPSMLAYWDRTLHCRYANRAYKTWFGADPELLPGSTLQDLLGPALFALNEPYIRAALRGEVQTFERSVPGPDGVVRHSLAHYIPDVQGGEVAGFFVQVTEVTPLKQTQAQLQSTIAALEAEAQRRRTAERDLFDSQQGLALTLAGLDAGFVATDRDGRVTQMNALAERVLGWTQPEALGQSVWQVFEREGRPPEAPAFNPIDLMIRQGVTIATTHHVVAVSRGGERTPLELRAALTRTHDGRVSGIVMVFRDMTRMMRAEGDAKRLAAIVESSYDAIVGKTLDGRITSWNKAAEALFGYTADEAIGQPIQMLIPPERQHEEMRIVAELARGVRVPTFATVRRAKDGSLREVSISISPVRDALGRVVGASKIARDLAPQRQAEEARLAAMRLEAENRQIQQASRLKSQFLANMSHELRTPLNAIIGFADLLSTDVVPPDSPKRQHFLAHIANSGRHLLQLINDVLDLSKVEAGKFDFYPEPINLPLLVEEAVDVLHAPILQRRIRVDVDIDPSLDDLLLDPGRLKQVLYNYLSNAIKFTDEAGRVCVRALPEGPAHFRIEVEDTGIGIAEHDLPQLFAEFRQLDAGAAKRHQGTGLGLALTRRLVEAQGGEVGVRSVLGQGSVFHLVLNRVHGHDAPGGRPRQPRLRMLVIQGEDGVRTRIVTTLADAGFAVDGAGSGDQALAHAQAGRYDGMTLELTLPDRHGLGVLADIRRHGVNPEAAVVGVSVPDDSGQVAAFAIANVLDKPIRMDEVMAAMSQLRAQAQGPVTVMVIDDDRAALELMRAALESLGVHAVCIDDGRLALHELALHTPDAVILDLMMPELDGFALLDELRHLPTGRTVPVYIWTSMILTDDEYAGLARSARAIVSKGGDPLAGMLDGLRQWRPAPAALPDRGPK